MLLIDRICYSLVFAIFLIVTYEFLPSISFNSLTSDVKNYPETHTLFPNLIPCRGEEPTLKTKPSKEKLEKIFDEHSKWLKDPQKSHQAILCHLDLSHLDLSKVNLSMSLGPHGANAPIPQ